MASNSLSKFRPSFSAAQIHYLHQLVQSDRHQGTESLKQELDRYFKVFILKMEVGSISEAFSSTPKLSVEERLGLDDTKESAYQLYIGNPKLCTPYQIQQARTYMYENDLMTAAEESAFEEEMGL